jgi:hypothetical protein
LNRDVLGSVFWIPGLATPARPGAPGRNADLSG